MTRYFERFYNLLIVYIAILTLKLCLFRLKNMNIRQYRPFVYSIVLFVKRSLNLSLFPYPINVDDKRC